MNLHEKTTSLVYIGHRIVGFSYYLLGCNSMGIRRATIAVFGSTILRNLLSFMAIAYFSRSFGVDVLGGFFLFQSLLSVLVAPVSLGTSAGVEKRLSEGEDPDSVLGSALAVKLSLFAIASIVILLLRDPIGSYIGIDSAAPLLVIGLLLTEVGNLGDRTLRGEQRVSETAILQPLRTAIWAGGGAVLAWYGFGPWSLLGAYIAGLFAIVVVAFWRVDTSLGRPTWGRIKSLVSYSKFAAVGDVGGLVYNWADTLLIGFFLSQAAVGSYEIAWQVATATIMLGNAVRIAIFPRVNQLGAEGDIKQIESIVESAFVPSLFLVIPALVGTVLIGSDILSTVFAVSFAQIGFVLVILMLEKVQRSVTLVLIAPIHAVGQVKYDAYTTILALLMNIGLNVMLIPRFGIVGAALATTTAATLKTVTHSWVLSKTIRIRVPYCSLGWCTIAACVMGFGVVGVRPYVPLDTIVGLFGTIAFAGCVYTGIALISPTIRSRVADFLPFDSLPSISNT